MKKSIGLVVIIAALVLCSYYVMGIVTEKTVKKDLREVNQSNGLSTEIEAYDRGWFKSKALLKWSLQVPEHVITAAGGQSETVPAEVYRLEMPITIHHGPVIFTDKTVKFGFGYAHTDLSLPAKMVEQFNNTFTSGSTQPKLDLSLLISYLNNTSIDVAAPAFKLIAKQGNGQFDWLGMTSATTVSPNMKKIAGNFTIEGLRIVKDQLMTVMSAITSEYNLHKSDSGLYLGDASLSFPSLAVTNNDKKIFELGRFDAHSDTNIEEGLFSSHFKASLEKIALNDKVYGPGRLELAIRNLDADVLAKINQQANQIQQGSDSQRQQALLALLPELPKLFSKGAEFEISELNFVMPQGTIEGNLLVSLPKIENANPFELIQKVQGNGKVRVPTVVVKNFLTEVIKQKLMSPPQPQTIQQGIIQQMQQAGQAGSNAGDTQPPAPITDPAVAAQQAATMADKQLSTMVQSGVLTTQGDYYVVEISLNQGQLKINGKPFNPAMLKVT